MKDAFCLLEKWLAGNPQRRMKLEHHGYAPRAAWEILPLGEMGRYLYVNKFVHLAQSVGLGEAPPSGLAALRRCTTTGQVDSPSWIEFRSLVREAGGGEAIE